MTRTTTLPPVLRAVRAKLVLYHPRHGEHFYGLTSGIARIDVGASITVRVLNPLGQPARQAHVVHQRADGSLDVRETDERGTARFYLGRRSAFFSPQPGPSMVFIGDSADPPRRSLGDRVDSLGLPEGHRCEYVITFQELIAEPAQPVAPEWSSLDSLPIPLAKRRALRAEQALAASR